MTVSRVERYDACLTDNRRMPNEFTVDKHLLIE